MIKSKYLPQHKTRKRQDDLPLFARSKPFVRVAAQAFLGGNRFRASATNISTRSNGKSSWKVEKVNAPSASDQKAYKSRSRLPTSVHSEKKPSLSTSLPNIISYSFSAH